MQIYTQFGGSLALSGIAVATMLQTTYSFRLLAWFFGSGAGHSSPLSSTLTTSSLSSIEASSYAPLSLPKPAQENLPEPFHKQYGWLIAEQDRALHEGSQGSGAKPNNRFSICWRQAMRLLASSCKDMDMPTKQRIALHLASCHLEEGGRQPVRCPEREKDVRNCLKRVQGDAAWSTYTDLFLFADSYCSSLQTDAWQTQTELLINKLGQSSLQAVTLLGESAHVQNTLLKNQQESTLFQKDLADSQHQLHAGLEASTIQFSRLTDEVETGFGAIGEQYQALLDMQESNIQRQKELLAGLQRANEEVRDFTMRIEEEFVKESQRFNLVKQVLRQACVILDIALYGGRLASMAVCVGACWILAPATTEYYASKCSAVAILLTTLVSVVHSVFVAARYILSPSLLSSKVLVILDTLFDGGSEGIRILHSLAVVGVLLSLWRRIRKPSRTMWQIITGRNIEGSNSSEYGDASENTCNDRRLGDTEEMRLRAVLQKVVHGGTGTQVKKGVRRKCEGVKGIGRAISLSAGSYTQPLDAASSSYSGLVTPLHSVCSSEDGNFTPQRRSARLQSRTSFSFDSSGKSCRRLLTNRGILETLSESSE
jgi:hypothetical protein